MIIKEMFYIPIKLKPELAHASMTTSDVNNQWRSNFQQQIITQIKKWYNKLFNVKYLPLFHHFKAIYQFPKHIIFWVKIVANASLRIEQLT
jgi:hypothetical protein